MGTGMMLSGAAERVLGCDRAGCTKVRRGRHGRFCSDACRAADWKARHDGAQRLIDWSAAESVPVPHPSSTEPAWLTPNQDFVGHSTEPPEELPQANPARRRRQDSTGVTTAPATGEPYESARLWLLARLQQGPVSTLELRREPWPASLNPAQRVLELRNRQYRIKTERVEGKTYYRLEQEG